MNRVRVLGFLALTFFILVGCSSGDGDGLSLPGLDSGPTPVVDQEQAIQTAETFLTAWESQDYNTMYGRISFNARDAYPQVDFTETYQRVWEDLRLQGLSWERGQVVSQGTTVIIQYTVTFRSGVLGEFTDANRVMRVIPTDEGMRIAWSRMDIFDGWSGGARLRIERTLPNRGNIYDLNGRPLADQNGVALPIYLVKNQIPDINACISTLVPLLGLEYDDVAATFDRYNFDTLFYVGEIDQETYQQNGVDLETNCRPQLNERRTRRYFGTAAPHVLGYIGYIPAGEQAEYESRGYPPDALVGIAGIESAWENELRGTIGNRLALYAANDELIRVITEKQATPGESVYMTLDRDLQDGIQGALAEAYSLAGPTWAQTSLGAAVVVIDVNTGAIKAMVSYPTFDPAVFNPDSPYLDPGSLIQAYQNDPARPLLNRATQGRYPLGSVFKLVTSIAGADSGVMSLDTLNNCSGRWDGTAYGDRVRTDWYPQGHGVLDGRGAIINSCNPYYWSLGVALENADPYLLPNYAKKFGFGQPSGLRNIQEEVGRIQDPDWKASQGFTWGVSDTLNLVIGQGEIEVNPMQVVRMTAAIANGGKLLTPYLVEKVQIIGEEPSYVHTPQSVELGLNPDVLAEVRQAMCDVTMTPSGTARFIFGPWYEFHNNAVTVCGKTGTAQAGNNQPHAWFASYAPADNPQIAIVVMVENSCEGSEVAAPITRRVLEIYYGLPQSEWPPLWQSGCSQIVVQ